MLFTERTLKYFSGISFKIRAAMAKENILAPFEYEDESFFRFYEAMIQRRVKRKSRIAIATSLQFSKEVLKELEERFLKEGVVGLLSMPSSINIPTLLERLIVLIKSARPHENASHTLRLADALEIDDNVTLDLIRQTQRCYGYGRNLNQKDIQYYHGLQHILSSINRYRERPRGRIKDEMGIDSFFDYEHDPFQQRVELFRNLSECRKRRQIRPILKQFGIQSSRFYALKERYLQYGIWGLVDLVQKKKSGEKMSPELELQIIEERLIDPSLSISKMIINLKLKCSKAHVQKVYARWGLTKFKKSIPLRGVVGQGIPSNIQSFNENMLSAKSRFPRLIQTSNLQVNKLFSRLINGLAHRKVMISNPGVLLLAPFLDQLGVVEAVQTYGPLTFRSSEITNNIISNVLRIIAGFPTINNFAENSDRSVAIGSGLSLHLKKSRFYDSLDLLRFENLQKLRNDAACRARELGVIEGKSVAIDYHCDSSDSRFPGDKSISKSPDKNGNMVNAHRPQIIWDSMTNTIINIAYCEGRSRAPSALYRFCEQNLFKVIDANALQEIYADSEYTGERQLVYLSVRSRSDITMCLKQNPKIKKWKEEVLAMGQWEKYGQKYRIACKDFILAELQKPFRFIVKQNVETDEIRCFGSTHVDYSPQRILDSYHIRWPVETGIKDLIENYFLNKPTGTSPEKVETHYYCVMLARLTFDYFMSVYCDSKQRSPEDWDNVLSTLRTTIFSNQNCELRLHESGDLMITYLDGDRQGHKKRLSQLLQRRTELGLNKVSWWGNRGVQIEVKNQYDL